MRRRLLAALVLGLAALSIGLARADSHTDRVEAACADARPVRIGDTVACAHVDVAPPGIDVHDRPSTAELRAREGAGPAAYQAAQDLGVAATEVATTATDPSVPCDGDGTSGYRVQGMYVVEAGRTNRYADLKSSFQLWAAGTDDVVNRSAALTGGVRHLRYATEAGGAGCVASVLNVTVPAGSMTSFSTTVSAVQALGYTSPGRKYLMWTDATVLCGVASMYTTDSDTQANPNNGSYAQYARVDAGCWGLGNGTSQHSVEAHEILHTLGGVQNTAPHSTKAGHCWDESDTMCYADGGTHAMVQICPPEREFFFDCNNDDYFSTYPDPGSYLDTHWNAADSRFLIGGGDGTGGGTLGSPTTLGATIAVNNPAVPGLSTQASVTPALPAGRTLTKVAWTSKRADCVFSAPAALQTDVTCNATVATATTVTAVLTDSTGATKSVTSPLTFAAGTARPVTVSVAAASQTGTASVCTGAAFPVRASVVDNASGQPVKGLSVTFTKQAGTATIASSAGAGITTLEGAAVLSQSATLRTTYVAKTAAGTVYAAGAPATVVATPGSCAPTLTAAVDTSAVYYADPVTVTGTLTRTVGGATIPVAGASLPVRLTAGTKVGALGNAVTAGDGTFRLVVKPTFTGTLSVELTGSTAYVATKVSLGTVTVTVPETRMTATATPADVGYGNGVTVTGTLRRDAGGTVTALTNATASVRVTKPGTTIPTVIGSAKVLADGTFSAVVPLKVSGTLSVAYAGAPGQPASSVTVGTVTAGTWTTAVTANASAGSVVLGGSVTFTGSVTKTYGGSTVPAGSLRVVASFTPTGSTTRTLVTSGTTTASGTYTLRVFPKATGTWTLTVPTAPGYAESTATPRTITVS
ncbi:MAG: hypothetical protein J7518_23270 [Nocardioidaceae bacterium]|nr:hypothetical protein [Nocardioidaceae bacterium]